MGNTLFFGDVISELFPNNFQDISSKELLNLVVIAGELETFN